MAARVGRRLYTYSRSSCISMLRPVAKVTNKTPLSAYVTSPIIKGKLTTRLYSDDTHQFNEPGKYRSMHWREASQLPILMRDSFHIILSVVVDHSRLFNSLVA